MGVVAKDRGGKDFAPPPTGVHPALCIDVIDLGEQETPFMDERTGKKKVQPQIQIVWQLEAVDATDNPITRDDGLPFRVSKFYTLSLNEKSNLRKDLEAWRGKAFTDEELADGFDVEVLLGIQCQLSLAEKKNQKGDVRVVVNGVLPKHRLDPQIEKESSFLRELEKPGGKDTRSPAADGSTPARSNDSGGDDDDADDLPF